MMYKTMCTSCAHLSDDPETGEPFCAAFQGPPPLEIWQDGFDHREEFPGDNGIRFTPDGPTDVDWLDKFKAQAP